MTGQEYRLVTVFGGGGFIGRYVCEELMRAEARVRVACREPRRAHFIQPLGQVGQLGLVKADGSDPASTARAVEGADSVINLIGSFKAMHAAHVAAPATIARAARDAGAKALVHVSAIGADAGSEAEYARTKAEGEAAVRDAFPQATIVRPSIVFGPEDQFTNRLARLSRLPVLPVIAPSCRFQPVYVEDLAKAIAAAALDPAAHAGKTYEIAGPQLFTMRELTREILKAAGRDTALADVPGPVASFTATYDVWATERPKIEIYGSDGTLSVPDPNTFGGPVRLYRRVSGAWEEVPLDPGFTGQDRGLGLADVAHALRHGGQPRAGAPFANHLLELMQLTQDAGAIGHTVHLTTTCERPVPFDPHEITMKETHA